MLREKKKSPVTRPGIDPGTFRLAAQRLNHYATPGTKPRRPIRLIFVTETWRCVLAVGERNLVSQSCISQSRLSVLTEDCNSTDVISHPGGPAWAQNDGDFHVFLGRKANVQLAY